MRITAWTILLSLAASGIICAQRPMDEEKAIREVIREAYVMGVFNKGIVRNIELGISPEFRMLRLSANGELETITRQDWIDSVKRGQQRGAFPLAEKEAVSVEYRQIDISGKAAVAKLHFYRGGKLQYVDFLSLYHFPGGWMITGKIFDEK